jgi:HK97 gp10 family phage protein
MAKLELKVTGLKEVEAALKTLPARVAKKVLRQAMRKGQKIVQAEVKALAPVRTGATRKAVKVRAGKRKKDTVRINVQIGKGDYKGATYYAAFPEYGTKGSGRKGKHGTEGAQTGRGGQRAQHYMKRAFEAAGQRAADTTMEAIVAGIENEATKKG